MAVDTTEIAIAITGSVVEILFTIVTVFRLVFRLRIQRLWWEDAWAAVAMLAALAYITSDLMTTTQNSYIAHRASSYAFTTAVWSVRMSLLYSILRVTSPSTWLRNCMRATGASFVVVWALLVSLKTWWCYNRISAPGPQECNVPRCQCISILEVAVDLAGDAILIVLSLRLLWKIKLPRRQRRMIMWSFSANVIMSMGSLLHAIAQINHGPHLVLISTNLELVSCLIICNLLVVVTYIYRVFANSSESESSSSSEDDDFTTPVSGRTTRSLTTVDLSAIRTTTTPVISDQAA